MTQGMKLVRTLAFAALLGLAGTRAMAFQVADAGALNAAVSAIALDEPQKAAVNALIEKHKAGLESKQAATIMVARKALLEPMMSPQASIGPGYRSHLSSKMLDILTSMAAGPDESAINAMIIAGEIATQGSVELVIKGLDSKSASVRRAAAYAAQRTFLALQNHPPAMLQAAAEGLVAALQKRLESETDQHVVLALVQAHIEASRLRGTNGQQFNLGNLAIESLCKALTGRPSMKAAKAFDTVEIQALINAVTGTRDLVGGRAGVVVPNTVQLAAAELGGFIIAHTRRVVAANGLTFEDIARRELYGQSCDAAVTLIGLVGVNMQPGFQMASPGLGELLRKGNQLNDAAFLKGCDDAIAALTKAPFSIPAARLK